MRCGGESLPHTSKKNKSIGKKHRASPPCWCQYQISHLNSGTTFTFLTDKGVLGEHQSHKVVWNPFTFLSPPPDCRYHRAGYTTLNVYFYFCCYIEVPFGFLFFGLLDLLWGRGVKCVYVGQRTTCKCWFISPFGAHCILISSAEGISVIYSIAIYQPSILHKCLGQFQKQCVATPYEIDMTKYEDCNNLTTKGF